MTVLAEIFYVRSVRTTHFSCVAIEPETLQGVIRIVLPICTFISPLPDTTP